LSRPVEFVKTLKNSINHGNAFVHACDMCRHETKHLFIFSRINGRCFLSVK